MTDSERKRVVSKLIKAEKNDKRIKRDYLSYWGRRALVTSIVSFVYILIYVIIKHTTRSFIFSRWLLAPIIFDFILTMTMLSCCFMSPDKFYLSGGREYESALGILAKILCFFNSLVPIDKIIYYFNYDVESGTCSMSFWKIILLGPAVLAVLLLISAFYNTSAPYSDHTDRKGNSRMTKTDWVLMRQQQEIAGLDPDKMPVVLSASQIKKMTKTDWYLLGMDLKLAGYDVFKNNK